MNISMHIRKYESSSRPVNVRHAVHEMHAAHREHGSEEGCRCVSDLSWMT